MRNPCTACSKERSTCKTCFAGNVWKAHLAKRRAIINKKRDEEREYDGFVSDIRLKKGGNGHQW